MVTLRISLKLDILRHLLLGREIGPFLDALKVQEVVLAHSFVWEKALELGIRAKGRGFSTTELLNRMKSLRKQPRSKQVREYFQIINMEDLFQEDRERALDITKFQIDALTEIVGEYLQTQIS